MDLLDHCLRLLLVVVTSPEGKFDRNRDLRLQFVRQLLEGGLFKVLADLCEFENTFLTTVSVWNLYWIL